MTRPKVPSAKHDALIPDAQVAEEMGVTLMSLWRWDRNKKLIEAGWPPPVYLNKRRYRGRKLLEEFKAQLIERAIKDRDKQKVA